jgi:hypothetical protein
LRKITKNELYLQKLNKISGSFRLKDLEDYASLPFDFENSLEESDLFFWTYDNWGSREYLSKEAFFDESVFSLHLADNETHEKMLVAPARFKPFTQKILPMKINGHTLPLSKKKISLKCLKSVYEIDNGLALIEFMQRKYGRDFPNLEAVAANCHVPVYDLSGVELKAGAHLKVSLHGGYLSAQVYNSEDIDFQGVQNWCETMERVLCGVLDEFGPLSSIYTQLEQAYFYGPAFLRSGNSMSIRDFLKLSKKIKIMDFVFRKIIWYEKDSPTESLKLKSKALQVLEELRNPHLSAVFVSFLNEDLRQHFHCEDTDTTQTVLHHESELAVMVRKIALWLVNNRTFLCSEDFPIEEVLMFYASFADFQRICQLYSVADMTANEDLQETFQMSSEILIDLMAFLQTYFLAE